jgi:hypothetical protein
LPPISKFNGFLSYAHIDARASPSLIEALTTKLETLVTAKLINAELSIFYDVTRLHTGDRWDPTIDKALRQSDILIVLFTPGWIKSDYCRKEYLVFEEIERSYGGGGYVVPILARPIGEEEQYLTPEQRLVHESVSNRQYFPILASDFLQLDENARQKALEEVGDDIVGILRRRRELAERTSSDERPLSPKRTAAEWRYPRSIQDFEKVDFISDEEVLIDQARDRQPRGIYAQIDFAERLSVEGNRGNSARTAAITAVANARSTKPRRVFREGIPGMLPDRGEAIVNERAVAND